MRPIPSSLSEAHSVDLHGPRPVHRSGLTQLESVLLLSFLAFLVLPVLYLFRSLDNNTLTNWQWVFAETGPARLFASAGLAIVISGLAAQAAAFERRARLVLPVMAGVTVYPLWGAPEILLDASRYIVQAKSLSLYGIGYFWEEWGRGISVWTDLPAIPFFYGLLWRYLGESRAVIQCFNTLLFAGALLLTYGVGRRLWNETVGFHGALLLMGIPYLLVQVPLLLVDVPTLFLLMLTCYTFCRALEDGSFPWIVAAGLAVSLTLLSKYSAWPMLTILPVLAMVLAWRGSAAVLRASFGAALVTAMTAGPIFLAKADVVTQQLELLFSYQWDGLSRWQESPLSTFLFQVHPFITLLALVGLYLGMKRRDARVLVLVWGFVLVGFLQIDRIRYLLPLFPFFALTAAYGLQTVRDPMVRRFVSCCIVSTSLVITLGAYLPFLKSTSMMNLARAGAYLDTLGVGAVEVSLLPQEASSGATAPAMPILDLFTERTLFTREAWPVAAAGLPYVPLRFTWEMRQPAFYTPPASSDRAPLVIIASGKEDLAEVSERDTAAPDRQEIRFDRYSNHFRFRTLARILHE